MIRIFKPRILLTGNCGFLGSEIDKKLIQEKMDHKGLDIKNGVDLTKINQVEPFIKDYNVIIHTATFNKNNSDISEIGCNLSMISNILHLSYKYAIKKIIHISSVDAMGIFKGEGIPEYFPIDEEHQCLPKSDYGISKKLCEELCDYYGTMKKQSIITLRPPGIWSKKTYSEIDRLRNSNPEYEWQPFWEYGSFIDIDDIIDAILIILKAEVKQGHEVYNICSDDITTSGKTSIELCTQIHPGVKWKNRETYNSEPFKAILSNEKIKKEFGWKPKHSWKEYKSKR